MSQLNHHPHHVLPIQTHTPPPQRPRWHRLRSALLLLLAVALLPLFATVPAQAATPGVPRALAAALAQQGISLTGAPTTSTSATTHPATAASTPPGTATPAAATPTAATPTAGAATTAEPPPPTTEKPPATTEPTSGGSGNTGAASASTSNTSESDTPTIASSTGAQQAESAATDATGTWTISGSVRQFLAGLNLTFPAGPLTGTVTGTTLTVTIAAPTLPLTLPGGVTLTVTTASIAVDEATGTLTLTGTVDAGNGIGGSVSVTIAHSSGTDLNSSGGTDLSSTVSVTAVPILGTTVDLTGTLTDSAGTVSASLTGTLDQDVTVASGVLTIAKGTSVTLSSSDGLAVSGTAVIGSGDSAVTIDVAGSIKGAKDFTFSVDDTTNPVSFTPVSGLTLTPALTGTITDTKGTVRFAVSADDAATWNPTGGVSLALTHVEISNDAPGSGVHCPASFTDGDIWVDVTGKVSDSASGVSATGGACIDPTAQSFTVSAQQQGSFGPSDLGFGLSGADLSVTGDVKAGTVSASVAATLNLTAVSGSPSIPVTLDFGSDGSFTGSASVDLSQLGLGSGSGSLLLSSKEVKKYVTTSGATIDLPAGVTVLFDYTPDNQVKQVFKLLNAPAPQRIRAQASLSTTGFSIALALDLGNGTSGIAVLPTAPGGFQIYLNSLQLKVALTETSGSITIGGTAQLHIPALYQGSTASDVGLTLNGSLALTADSVKITAGFDLAAVNGTWTNAFGIPGLSIGELAASVGVEEQPEDAGIPLPTVSFTVNDVVLPTAWAGAVGEVPGASVSATLDLDVDNPILSFAISPGAGQTVALEPLRIANDFTSAAGAAPLPDSVVDALQIKDASLLFAPVGGTDATMHTVSPGVSLVFDAVIAGHAVHVDGSVGVSPYPHLTAHVSVPGFSLGPVTFSGATAGSNPSLAIDVEANPAAPKIDFDVSGAFTDVYTGIQFSANVDLGASISALNAAVTLHIAGGQPAYIAGDATLTGSVTSENGGLAFAASGYAGASVAGKSIGSIWFSYSTDTGAIFAKLTQLGNQIADWFRYVYGESDVAVAGVLNQIGVGADQIASTLQSEFGDTDAKVSAALTQINISARQVASTLRNVFADGDVAVASALNKAGVYFSNTAIAVKAAFNDSDTQIASALNQIGIGAAQIASALQTAFGDSEAAVYNAFQQIGQGGQSVLDAINGFFNTGSYWIYSHPWYSVPLFLDNSGGSYAAFNGLIQYTWTGGHNQDWYVLPTDSGYAEIVNRQSGQCLSEFGGAGAQVVQYPCYGWSEQQWYLGVYPGQNLNYTGHTVTNRWSGLDLDVYQGSTSAGTGIDTWTGNGGWNQWFTFEPAIG